MLQFIVDVFLFLLYTTLLFYIYALAWRFWVMAVQAEYTSKLKWILLEVKLPRVVDKSPKAFEIAAGAFLQFGGIGNRYNIFWKGNMPAYHTLEIVSLEGNIHFYIRTQSKYKSIISNNIYSQYPTVEITEVDDYMERFKMDHHTHTDKFSMWGINYKIGKDIKVGSKPSGPVIITLITKVFKFIVYIVLLQFLIDIYDNVQKLFSKEDSHHNDIEEGKEDIKIKASYLPISTYIDYEMDKDPKEIFKHDPLTPVLEWLGSLSKGQYGIYQICISDEEGNFKGKGHGLAGGLKGDERWPAIYENEIAHKQMKLSEVAKLRLDQIRMKPEKILHKKGDLIFDAFMNPVEYDKETGEVDENGKKRIKKVQKKYGADILESSSRIKEMDLYSEEKDEIDLIKRKLSKPTFAATLRTACIILDDHGDGGANVQSQLTMMKQFGRQSFGYNFTPAPMIDYDYDWQDTMKKKKPWRAEESFEALVERESFFVHVDFDKDKDTFWDLSFWNMTLNQKKMLRIIYDSVFHPFTHNNNQNVFVINTEELATLYHFPGEVAATPGLKRIDSVKGDAPSDLPI